MTAFEASPGERQDLFARLAALEGETAIAAFFSRRPELKAPGVVAELCGEVARLGLVDLGRAARLARVGRWLAEAVDDDRSRGLSLRALANILHFEGDSQGADRAYREALARFEQVEDEDEVAITKSHALLNLAYVGDFDRAFAWAAEARERFAARGNRKRLARLDLNLGTVLTRQDRYTEAYGRFEASFKAFVEESEAEGAAVALRNIAVCHQDLSHFAEALEAYRWARALCQERGLTRLLHAVDYNVAFLHYLRGDYTRALELLRAARATSEKLDDRRHVALCDLDQGEIYLELNLVEEAAELERRAVEGFRRLGMRPEAARALTDLAIALSRQGKAFAALEELVRAREAFVREQSRIWPALIDLYRALILYKEGRTFEAASLAASAAAAFEAVALPSKTAMCEILAAEVAVEAGDFVAARAKCDAALARLEPLGVPGLEYQAHFVRGRLEEAEGDLPAAFAAYQRAHDKLERLRSHLQAEELKVSLVEDKLAVYESLVWLSLQGAVAEGGESAAFAFLEKAKARSLADLVAFRAQALPAKTATRSSLVEEIRGLREELSWYYRQIDRREMEEGERSRKRAAELRRISRQQEERMLRSLKELQVADRELSSLQQAATIELETIQKVIPPGTSLVEYYIARDTVFGCVVGDGQLRVRPLTVASRIHDLHRQLAFHLSKFPVGLDAADRDLVDDATQRTLEALYRELFAPLADGLEGSGLVVIPHGALHALPFHAFFDGQGYLSDRFSISYAPAASVYYLCQTKRVDPDGTALVTAAADPSNPQLLAEAQAVAEALPDCRLLGSEEATAEAIKRASARCRIVHLAAQGSLRHDNPMFSSIRLGRAALSLFDLYNLSLEARLVVLTGCGPDLGAVARGDELVGLSRGLLYAGARAVMITLWNVAGAARAEFVRLFYRHLGAGSGPVEAIRLAAKSLRESHPNPYYWAPYALVGASDGEAAGAAPTEEGI